MQEPLPGPTSPDDIDPGLGDAELFEAAFLPNPSDGLESLGDLWCDVPWQISNCVNQLFFQLHTISPLMSQISQADIPAVLRYLAGCKYLCPRGKWVMASWYGQLCSQVSKTYASVRHTRNASWSGLTWNTSSTYPIGDVQIWLKAWCSWFNQLFQLLQNSPFVDRSRLVFAISTAILHRENPWNDRERTPNDRERTVKFVKLCHGHFWKFWYLLAALFDSSEILVSTAALFDSSEQWRFHRDLMSLQDLPFDLTELNWGKLSTVKKILKLSEEEAVQVMTHVLGPRPSET